MKIRKVLATLLAVFMIVMLMPVNVKAIGENPGRGNVGYWFYTKADGTEPSSESWSGKDLTFTVTDVTNKYVKIDKVSSGSLGSSFTVPSTVSDGTDTYYVKEIAEAMFYDNSDIEEVIISNGVEIIGERAFILCKNLKSVSIPDSVKKIGQGAFQGCSSLTEFTLPGGVTDLGDFLFFNSQNLKRIYVNALTPPVINYTEHYFLKNCNEKIKLYVPANSLEAYRNSDYWKEYMDILCVAPEAGTDSWAGLQLLIDASTTKTITLTKDLMADIDEDTGFVIASGKNITLDLNGYTLDRGLTSYSDENGYVISVESGATLTVKDSSTEQNGKLCGGYRNGNGGGVLVSGTFNLESGSISGCKASQNGGGIYLSSGTFNMSGGKISGCSATDAGAVYICSGSTLNMTGGKITDNSGNNIPGVDAVYVQGSFSMMGGEISNNKNGNFMSSWYPTWCSTVSVADGGSILLGKNARITDNYNYVNVQLADGSIITLASGANAPTSGMLIGVTMDNPSIFTNEADGCLDYFVPDNTTLYYIEYTSDKKLEMLKKNMVTFNVNGVSGVTAPTSEYLKIGEKVTEPTDPTAATMAFVAWYSDSDCMTLYDFYAVPSSDITLYAGWKYLEPTGVEGGENKITGVDSTMEYRLFGDSDWTSIDSSEIDEVQAGEYEVRIKQNGKYFASDSVNITVTSPDPTKPDAPTGVEGGVNKITGVDATMEYQAEGTTEWTTITDTQINNLPAGNYFVRIKATADSLASDSVKITVTAPEPDGDVLIPPEKKEENFGNGGIENSSSDLYLLLLDEEDTNELDAGKNIYVWVDINEKNDVSEEETQLVEESLPEGFNVGVSIDVSLWKQIEGNEADKVTDVPNGKIKIGISIPSELQKDGRSYKIVRIHDGVAEVLEAEYNPETGMLYFETDKFSHYSLIYKDKDPDNNPNPDPAPEPEPEPEPVYYEDLIVDIRVASSGVVEWDKGDSLPIWVFKELVNYPSVAIRFNFVYEGEEHSVFIPAGTAEAYIDESIPWYGPAWLLGHFGEAGPISNAGTVEYTVKQGDTLLGIANAYKTTLDEILRLNPSITDADSIREGQKIIVYSK